MNKELITIKDEHNDNVHFIDKCKYNLIQNILLKESDIQELNRLKIKNNDDILIVKSKIKILKKSMIILPALIISLICIVNFPLIIDILIGLSIGIITEFKILNKIKVFKETLENLYFENKCINKQINIENKNFQIRNEKILQKTNIDKNINEQKKSLQELEALIIYNKNKEEYYYYFKLNKLEEYLNSIYNSEIANIIYEMIKEDLKKQKNKCKKKVM